jgi:glutamyl-tRNA synthetase
VRFRVPEEGATTFTDVIRGELSFANADLEDFVVWRSAGGPTFYLANAVDDVDMDITHVIRGEDLLSSTPRVLLCRQALGTPDPPVYAHLPVLVDEQRKKLSKRKGDVAVADYREKGYLPDAMVNYLATLGWGPPDGVEIRPMDEILDLFRLEDVNPSPAFFDVKKLTHFNGEWIRRLTVDEFIGAAGRFLEAGPWAPGDFDFGAFETMAPLVQERVTTLAEVPAMVDFLFLPDAPVEQASWDKAIGRNELARPVLEGVLASYAGSAWDAASLKAALEKVGAEHDLKLGKAQAPVRVAVTGRTVGPPLFESLEVLGRDETLRRLREALAPIE